MRKNKDEIRVLVSVENLQDIFLVTDESVNLIKKAIEASVIFENFNKSVEVCVTITDNEKIRELNFDFRGIDKSTDVLSFPMFEDNNGNKSEDCFCYDAQQDAFVLGDIVISIEKVIEQAEEFGHSFERELAFLTVHGMLHLLGYDHKSPEEENLMRNMQSRILDTIGLKREGN